MTGKYTPTEQRDWEFLCCELTEYMGTSTPATETAVSLDRDPEGIPRGLTVTSVNSTTTLYRMDEVIPFCQYWSLNSLVTIDLWADAPRVYCRIW